MAAAMMSPLQMREPANTYNMMSLAQAQALVPALDLRPFLKALGIAAPARVQVVDIQAMKALQRLLTEQPAEDVKLLLRWYVLHVHFLPFVIVIFMAVHFWRVRKDGGISGPL